MDLISDTTGERAPGHCQGTDEQGRKLWLIPDGYTPEEPYWINEEGFAIEGEAPDAETVECTYCSRDVPAAGTDKAVPALDDDDAWDALAHHHARGCEWVVTRAHRRDAA